MHKRGTRAGFTIVELLVVITITIILMGLIFGPIIGTFNLTRRATAMVQAQDTARSTLEQISREISQAVFVYDNSNSPINFPVQQPDMSTTPTPLQGLYGKIDIVLPKLVMRCNNPAHPSGQPREYERGDEAWPKCPHCDATDDQIEARALQPMRPDSTIVRYFIGLADNSPGQAYRDWPEDDSYPVNGFILYRAEFKPYNDDGSVNTDLFDKDKDGKPLLDDPNFFYGTHWQNWKAISRPVGPKTETDLVSVQLDSTGKTIVSATPSVRFQLSQMTNDTFSPSHISDEAAEVPSSIPTVFRASYGSWGSSLGTLNDSMYTISLCRYDSVNPGNNIWYRTVWTNGRLDIVKYPGATIVFGITDYEETHLFPTTPPDVAFRVDPQKGEVRFDFPGSDAILADGTNSIHSMNTAVANNWLSKTEDAVRNYQIKQFAAIPSGGAYQPRIIPGSEIVTGPDMTPGLPQSQIKIVRYERVPFNLGDPGPNQYKIDYGVDDATGKKVGWLIFSPSHDDMIPENIADASGSGTEAAHFAISYKFQLNRDNDVVLGNYTTKSLMQITLGIRYYDRNSGKLQPIELTNKVRVRNLLR